MKYGRKLCSIIAGITVSYLLAMTPVLADVNKAVYTIKPVKISEDSDEEIHSATVELAQNLSDPVTVKNRSADILKQVKNGKEIDEYDYLWTQYALLRIAYAGSGSGLSEEDDLEIALNTIDYLDQADVGEWQYTELGAFKMEVYRTAANSAAWSLKESDSKKALELIEKGLTFARDIDTAMQDTYVRVLINVGEKTKAFTIVKQLLEQDPGFNDFQDFTKNEEYLAWAKAN